MQDPPDTIQSPPSVRWLKIMVTVLTMTMIAGITTIVVLFVIRFRDFSATVVLPLPESITMPDDSNAVAFTQGRNWYAVVTEDDEILIFDREDGELIRAIKVVE